MNTKDILEAFTKRNPIPRGVEFKNFGFQASEPDIYGCDKIARDLDLIFAGWLSCVNHYNIKPSESIVG